jgi:hypothetical protein
MENSEPFALYVDDDVESYLAWRKQAMEVHLVLGTQRLLDLKGLSIRLSEVKYDQQRTLYQE